ncbi:PA3496 family putative envelope integrity protein [Shewanella colwelliana]|uniref:PA3496 family putative envelope integrity protein n=1 Tax=Shewanella colwelliana TaxID=23 RepID=UPI0037367B8F
MTKPSEKQKRFIINTATAPNANTINAKARAKPKPPSPEAAKGHQIRRDIEWHMDQRRLKQELADFGITDENLS